MFSPICRRCTRNSSCVVSDVDVCPDENNRILHQMTVWVQKSREARLMYEEWHDDYLRIVKEKYTQEEWRNSMDREVKIRTEIGRCEQEIVNLASKLIDEEKIQCTNSVA